MTCKELSELLTNYLLEELRLLEDDIGEQVREHLRACDQCEIYYESYEITIQVSRRLRPRPLSSDFAQRLLDSIRELEKES